MSVENFLREAWAKNIQDDLELKGQLTNHCTREYEGDCEYAKTVRILGVGEPTINSYTGTVEYEELSDKKQNLPIDIQEYFAFVVDDVDKAQSQPGLPQKYQEKSAKRLSQRRELNVGRLVAGKCLSTEEEEKATKSQTTDTDIVLYKDYYIKETKNGQTVYKRVPKPKKADIANYYDITSATYKEGATNVTTASAKSKSAIKTAIDTALVNLRLRNNEEGGYLEIDPASYGLFKDELIELDTNNSEMIRRGAVGMYDNYVVTRTNALYRDKTHVHCFAHSGKAIAFVAQINKVEALRLEGTFGDGIRGLDTYGMKIIAQDELEAIKVPV